MLMQSREFGVHEVVMCDAAWRKTKSTLTQSRIMLPDRRQNKAMALELVLVFMLSKKREKEKNLFLMNYCNINKGQKLWECTNITLPVFSKESENIIFSL